MNELFTTIGGLLIAFSSVTEIFFRVHSLEDAAQRLKDKLGIESPEAFDRVKIFRRKVRWFLVFLFVIGVVFFILRFLV